MATYRFKRSSSGIYGMNYTILEKGQTNKSIGHTYFKKDAELITELLNNKDTQKQLERHAIAKSKRSELEEAILYELEYMADNPPVDNDDNMKSLMYNIEYSAWLMLYNLLGLKSTEEEKKKKKKKKIDASDHHSKII